MLQANPGGSSSSTKNITTNGNKGNLTTFHNNKELEIALEQVELETKGDNQLDQWSIPPTTSREPM